MPRTRPYPVTVVRYPPDPARGRRALYLSFLGAGLSGFPGACVHTVLAGDAGEAKRQAERECRREHHPEED